MLFEGQRELRAFGQALAAVELEQRHVALGVDGVAQAELTPV